jgi:hypothetical protein
LPEVAVLWLVEVTFRMVDGVTTSGGLALPIYERAAA